MVFITVLLALLGIGAGAIAVYLAGSEQVQDSARKYAKVFGIAAAILFVGSYLSTAIVTIGVGQVGVITRFGGVTGREITEGLSLKAPAAIESVVTFDTRVQKDELKATAASKDLQDVQADLILNYHIERGKVSHLYKTVGQDYKSILLDPAIQESFKAVSAQFTSTELIQQRDKVKSQTEAALTQRFEQYGVKVDSLNLVNFTFSAAFNTSIEAVQVANQRAKEAEAKLNQVKAEAEQQIAKANADAEAQHLQAQSITPEYLELQRINVQSDWIKRWDGKLPTTATGDNTLFTLPIGK